MLPKALETPFKNLDFFHIGDESSWLIHFYKWTMFTYGKEDVSPDEAKRELIAEVENYNEYMNGSWYGFYIEGLDGDVEDSCWGFLYNGDMKDLIDEMKACVSDKHHALFDKMVTSKAACM